MNHSISRYFFALFCVSMIAGCSNSSSSGTSTTTATGLSATVDGGAWNPVQSHAISAALTGQTAISSSEQSGESLGITLNYTTLKPGTYQIGLADSAGAVFVKENPSISYSGWSGQVVVSSWTATHITGTFNFVAINVQSMTDSVKVTNGSFNLDVIQD